MASGVKPVIAGILFALFLGGTYDHIYNIETNKCFMTYMFEVPQFIPVPFPASVKKLFPQYHLYSYGEGNFSQVLRDGFYEGIPVLFIPGNGGSYKQVRSLASVAYRKALEDETMFHFNFFSVDLNEELAAFYGPALKRQTEFVAHAVKQILRLYNESANKPKSIVLVGHSMGGMIARALYATEKIKPSVLPLIITQATPHTRPVLHMDHHLTDFYENVNTYWAKERASSLKDVVLITVGGGRNDIQVSTSHINTPYADIATTTSSVPSCWLTTDHQAIVWCKQLVMPIVRSLFDIVDSSTNQITTNKKLILDVFDFHLAKRITGKRFKRSVYTSDVTFQDGDWKDVVKRQYTHIANNTERNTYLLIPLNPKDQFYHTATIVATNLGNKDWVMACKSMQVQHAKKVCKKGENLSQKTKKLYGKVKAVQLDLPSLSRAGHTDLVVYIAPTDNKVKVSIDIYSENGRHRSVEVPAIIRSFTQTLVVDTTPQKALSYNVSLIGLQEPWQSFSFTLRPRQTCEGESVVTAKIYMPWAQKESYLQKSGHVVSFSAELDIPPPSDDNSSASIQFFLNPKCTYSVILQGSLIGVFRRLVWLYGAQIPTYCAVHLLLTLSQQLKGTGEENYCPSFFSAAMSLSPITVVPLVKVLNIIFRSVDMTDDFTEMSSYGENLAILPILLFLGTFPVTLVIGAVTWGMVMMSGNVAHSFVVKILGRSIGASETVGDLAVAGLSRVPVVIGVALISLAYSTCGTLALYLSCSFYFIKAFKLYEEYIENFLIGLIPGVKSEDGKNSKVMSALNMHITLMLLTFCVALFNTPTLIIWGKSVGHHLQLEEDPSRVVTVIVLVSLCFLWQNELPRSDRAYYKQLAYAVHLIAVLTMLFGSIHVYRVPYFVISAVVLLALHQVLAPAKVIVASSFKEDSGDISFSDINAAQNENETSVS